MNSIIFWKDWQKPYKQLYWGLIILFLAAIAFFCFSWAYGSDMSFPWETYAQRETIRITIDTINAGPFALPLEVDNYLITESFQGGELKLYKWPSYVFVALIAVVFTLAITCITALKRFWYLVGMGLVIVFLMSLQLETLQLFGQFDKTALIGVFVMYLPLSFYLHSINNMVKFSKRLMAFAGITMIVGLAIHLGAEVQYPFLHLATYSYTAPIIISVLFILMIAHEILTGFIFVITRNNNAYSKNSLSHFIIIAAIYLINLLIVVLNEIGYLHWELFNFHPFVLLLLSALIGLWLYQYREEAFGHVYSFYPIGGFIYLMLGSVCFFTIGFYLFSANDSIIEVFQDIILYAHVGYGFIFFVYVMANFLSPFGNNMQVYKVLYKPQNMPYFTYRLAGTIATVAFILVNNYMTPIYQGMASYYNAVGDLHAQIGDDNVAKVYYNKAGSLDYRNHRTNYTLGAIARAEGNNSKAALRFSDAIPKHPTPQAYVNMSNIYLDEGKFFDGLFTMKDGVEEFEHDDRSKINLGLLYDRSKEPDSAYAIYQDARGKSLTERSAHVNILALLNKGDYELSPDSLMTEYIAEKDEALSVNILPLLSEVGIHSDQIVSVDTLLNLVTGSALYNQSINNVFSNDSSYLNSLAQLISISENIGFREELKLAAALGYYAHGQVGFAFQLLDQLANNYPQKSGYYYYILGLYSLEQEANLLASDYFEKSLEQEYQPAKQALAIALSQAGESDRSIEVWNELSLDANPITRGLADFGLYLLEDSIDWNDDDQLYWYSKYVVTRENDFAVQGVLDAVKDSNYKGLIYADLVEYFLEKGDSINVQRYSNVDVPISDPQLLDRWYWLHLAKDDMLTSAKTENLELEEEADSRIDHYNARLSISEGDSITTARLFETSDANPFFEQGVIGKAEYLNGIGKPMKAYEVLQGALEVNPYSIFLRKQYILQCAKMDFDTFAEYALEELEPLVSSQEYRSFEEQYELQLLQTREESGF